MLGNTDEFCGKPHDCTVFRVERLILAKHFDPGVDQKHSKEIQYPVKTLDKLGTGKNHDKTHDERHKNAPK